MFEITWPGAGGCPERSSCEKEELLAFTHPVVLYDL